MASLTPERMSGGFFGRDPFETFETMRHLTDPLVDETRLPAFAPGFEPDVRLYERDGIFLLECVVAGFGGDDITVDARADRVTLAGEAGAQTSHGSFVRTVVLPQTIDPRRLAATLEDGLLTLVLWPSAEA